ncbi:MAG TPA: DNA gyrase subunit A [Anaerolineae bacterium]|nr:DNA gyrase subunit A [Anaerolineae bacterium]
MEVGTVQSVDIDHQMRTAYLDYAMSVIVARALPDVRDGLKPVHRRILYAMHDMGMHSNTPYKKSARIVGEVLGKYHPHGDSAVYDAMARMAQDFSMRYPLIDGQGNFGSIDGDSPAAMRYTEARMGKMAEEMLADIEKDTVDFIDNFDGSLQEPAVLPARLPNLLLNGSSGIAVGMATNIPPHNLRELIDVLIYMIDYYDHLDDLSVEDLLKVLPGPDFPTGGIIIGSEGIRSAYSTGRGRIVLRGSAHIEEMKSGRFRIVITEIPYQLNKSSLIERIAELARKGRIKAISDLRDESDRRGMSIIIELKRSAQPRKVLNQLYKYTPLQSTFGVQLLALVNGEPRLLSLKRALHYYIEHRLDIITRRTQFELKKAKSRAHILEGLLIALANLDKVIKTIRQSPNADIAKERLVEQFDLTEIQAQAILDMQLRRLVALERHKIEEEHKGILVRIAYLEDLLGSRQKMLALIKKDLQDVSKKYGDERRTRIAPDVSSDLSDEDLVADEAILISITERGYVKRVLAKTYRAQRRGGRGVLGHTTRDKDEMLMLIPARTLQTILFFSDRGKVYSEKAYQIPDASRTGRGIPMVNILPLEPEETITAAVPVPDFNAAKYCTMVTRKGRIKRVPLSKFAAVRQSGLIAIKLAADDALGWVRLTNGDNEIMLVTEKGQALRFHENNVRSMGRQAAGTTAIRLHTGDHLIGMEIVEPGGDLLVVTTNGYAKRTSLDAYRLSKRARVGTGTINKKALPKIGLIALARIVQPKGDLITLISANGIVLRTNAESIKRSGRVTRGVRIMNLQEGDTVAALARIASADLKSVGATEE